MQAHRFRTLAWPITLVRWDKFHLFSAETPHEFVRCRRWKRSYYGASISRRARGEGTSKPTERSRCLLQTQLTFAEYSRAISPSS